MKDSELIQKVHSGNKEAEMHWDMQCVVMSMQIEKFLLVR